MAKELSKSLNLFDGISLVAGSMIGSGIFIVSSDIARTLGSPGWLLVVWFIAGLLTVIAALSYGELASIIPYAGGQYVYLRMAYNPLTGFLFGWAQFLVVQGGSIAAVSMAFGKFLGVIFPWFSEDHVIADTGFLQFNTVHLVAILSIIFLTWINTRGISAGKYVQNLFTYTKVAALVLLILAGVFYARNYESIHENLSSFWVARQGEGIASARISGWSLIVALGTAMVGALFALDAWNNVTFAAGEVRNPKKTIPLSLFYGSLLVAVLYFFTNIIYLMSLPLQGSPDGTTVIERGIQFATNDRIGTASMEGILGNHAALVMAVFVVISTFGCNNGMILSGARVCYAMAKDNLFFKNISSLNNKNVPGNALIFQGVWASLLCLSGTYSDLLDFVIFTVLLFYVLTISGIFILRVKKPRISRPYKAFGYPILPSVYILATIFIMIILLIYKPRYTFPGLAIVIIGVPVYYLWKYSGRKRKNNSSIS